MICHWLFFCVLNTNQSIERSVRMAERDKSRPYAFRIVCFLEISENDKSFPYV